MDMEYYRKVLFLILFTYFVIHSPTRYCCAWFNMQIEYLSSAQIILTFLQKYIKCQKDEKINKQVKSD